MTASQNDIPLITLLPIKDINDNEALCIIVI